MIGDAAVPTLAIITKVIITIASLFAHGELPMHAPPLLEHAARAYLFAMDLRTEASKMKKMFPHPARLLERAANLLWEEGQAAETTYAHSQQAEKASSRLSNPLGDWSAETVRVMPRVDLTGIENDIPAMLDRARSIATKAGWSLEQIENYETMALRGDTDFALGVLAEHFDVEA